MPARVRTPKKVSDDSVLFRSSSTGLQAATFAPQPISRRLSEISSGNGVGPLKRTLSAPSAPGKSSNPGSQAVCVVCKNGRNLAESLRLCERCQDWSHSSCAGVSLLQQESEAFMCSRCATSPDGSLPDDGSKDASLSSRTVSLASSVAASPNGQNGDHAGSGESDPSFICPVCEVDCTCENKQEVHRRNSVFLGPVDVFDKQLKARKQDSKAPMPGAKRQRTMSSQAKEAEEDKKEAAGKKEKEERIIPCTLEGCDKTYTTMAGLRYHLKTFDHTKLKRSDSLDGTAPAVKSEVIDSAPLSAIAPPSAPLQSSVISTLGPSFSRDGTSEDEERPELEDSESEQLKASIYSDHDQVLNGARYSSRSDDDDVDDDEDEQEEEDLQSDDQEDDVIEDHRPPSPPVLRFYTTHDDSDMDDSDEDDELAFHFGEPLPPVPKRSSKSGPSKDTVATIPSPLFGPIISPMLSSALDLPNELRTPFSLDGCTTVEISASMEWENY